MDFKGIKVGDKLRALKTSNCKSFTKGNVYIVRREPTDSRDSVGVELDENGSTTNGWHPSYFEPAEKPAVPDLTIALSLEKERAQRLEDELAQVKADRDKTKRTVDRMTRERDTSKDTLIGQKSYLEQELRAVDKTINAHLAIEKELREQLAAANAYAKTVGEAWRADYEALDDKLTSTRAHYQAQLDRERRAAEKITLHLNDQLELARLERAEARDDAEAHWKTIDICHAELERLRHPEHFLGFDPARLEADASVVTALHFYQHWASKHLIDLKAARAEIEALKKRIRSAGLNSDV